LDWRLRSRVSQVRELPPACTSNGKNCRNFSRGSILPVWSSAWRTAWDAGFREVARLLRA